MLRIIVEFTFRCFVFSAWPAYAFKLCLLGFFLQILAELLERTVGSL